MKLKITRILMIATVMKTMVAMFKDANYFNGDISKWEVSKVTEMAGMFCGAKVFNQDLSKWDVSEVTTMYEMFWGATVFNQDLSNPRSPTCAGCFARQKRSTRCSVARRGSTQRQANTKYSLVPLVKYPQNVVRSDLVTFHPD